MSQEPPPRRDDDHDDLPEFPTPPTPNDDYWIPPPPPPPGAPPDFYDEREEYGLKPKRHPTKPKPGRHFTWNEAWIAALTQPNADTYRALIADPQASAGRGATWVFAASIVVSVISLLLTMGTAGMWFVPGGTMGNGMPDMGMSDLAWGMGTILCAPVGAVFAVILIAIGVGIQHVVALMLGGRGSYEKMFYATTCYAAPLMLAQAVLSIIPCVGPLMGLYGLYLNVQVIEAVHDFGTPRALITAFWWVVLGCLCVCAALALFSISATTVEDAIREILTPTPS